MALPMIQVAGLSKSFTLHTQGGIQLAVLEDVSLTVDAGECIVLDGPSGAGKSTLLRCLFGNYLPQRGCIEVRHRGQWTDMVTAPPQRILEIRRETMGHVSQFLRVIPRVPAIDVVREPLLELGWSDGDSRTRAARMLERLNIPERLWSLAPATFSGGEQQRINIARGFVVDRPILLLDEPTAALDGDNRLAVVGLIEDALARGAAIVGTFHDKAVRDALPCRTVPLRPLRQVAA
jgi:alpha-D-ribose 1-methylphosphonate 5-triphosphate synthase subunit PhnL